MVTVEELQTKISTLERQGNELQERQFRGERGLETQFNTVANELQLTRQELNSLEQGYNFDPSILRSQVASTSPIAQERLMQRKISAIKNEGYTEAIKSSSGAVVGYRKPGVVGQDISVNQIKSGKAFNQIQVYKQIPQDEYKGTLKRSVETVDIPAKKITKANYITYEGVANRYSTPKNYNNLNLPSLSIYRNALVEGPKLKQVSYYQQTPQNIEAVDYIIVDTNTGKQIKGSSRPATREERYSYQLNEEYNNAISFAQENLYKNTKENVYGITNFLEKRSKKYEGSGGNIKASSLSFSYGIGKGAIGNAQAVLNPVDTAKGIIYSAEHPVTTFNNLKDSFKKNPSMFIGELVGGYAVFRVLGKINSLGKTAGQEFIMKRLSSYETYGKRIQILPTQTVIEDLNKLKKYEGKNVKTTHVTISPELEYESILKEIPEQAGGLRKQIKQFGFFQYPAMKGEKITGLGGYAGITSKALPGESKIKFSLLSPKIKVFVFENQKISVTPEQIKKYMSASDIVQYQKSIGGTFLAPENLKRLSREKQVVTAFGGRTGTQRFRIAKAKSDLGKFTYYSEKIEPPSFLKGGTKEKIFDFLTKENKRIEIKPARLEKVNTGDIANIRKEVPIKEYSEGYGNTKYISPSSITKSYGSGIFSSLKSILSSISSPSGSKSSIQSSFKSMSSGSLSSSKGISSIERSLGKALSGLKGSSGVKSSVVSIPKVPLSPPVTSFPKNPPKPPRTTITSPPPRLNSIKYANKNSSGLFSVSIFRGQGKQRKSYNVGTAKTLNEALNLGRYATETNLARTFKIEGYTGKLPEIKGFRLGKTTKTRQPATLVQLSKFSLSSRGEKREIQSARRKRK